MGEFIVPFFFYSKYDNNNRRSRLLTHKVSTTAQRLASSIEACQIDTSALLFAPQVGSTLGMITVSDECGCLYSSLQKQIVSTRATSAKSCFGTAKRRGAATLNSGPGPADYRLRIEAGCDKDVVYRTKLSSSPSPLFPRCMSLFPAYHPICRLSLASVCVDGSFVFFVLFGV